MLQKAIFFCGIYKKMKKITIDIIYDKIHKNLNNTVAGKGLHDLSTVCQFVF
jgi:hypothetical protein